MDNETKSLFKLHGEIRWLNRNEQTVYFYLSKDKAIYRRATSEGQTILLFKRVIQLGLKKMFPTEYPIKFAHIFLDYAEIEVVKNN